jgi:molecular chaperone DnaK
MAIQRVREAAEKAKIERSSTTQTEINLPLITADAPVPNSSIPSFWGHILRLLFLLSFSLPLSLAKKLSPMLVWSPTTRRSTKSSWLVEWLVCHVFRILFLVATKGVNPDEAVAIGAAIQGGFLAGKCYGYLAPRCYTSDSVSESLWLSRYVVWAFLNGVAHSRYSGIETPSPGGIMTKLISHNATIPTKKSQVFCTGHENATIGFSPILYAFCVLICL